MKPRAAGTVIDNRYKVIGVLGQGGFSCTYRAEHIATARQVAVKELSLERAEDWKSIELFEREATVLKQLNHLAIPDYIDDFRAEEGRYFIVQELVEGTSLASLIEGGFHVDEREFRKIARQLLRALSYLHGLYPPVFHRDIKPHNIIRRDDGKVFLVDFGSVRSRGQDSLGSTVAGTFGYMPPEQLYGDATAASDLYAFGMTLVHLLGGVSPSQMPVVRMRLDFSAHLNVDPALARWLQRLIEPVAEDRFPSADVALKVLDDPASMTRYSGSGTIRRRRVAATVAVAVAAAAGLAGVVFFSGAEAPPAKSAEPSIPLMQKMPAPAQPPPTKPADIETVPPRQIVRPFAQDHTNRPVPLNRAYPIRRDPPMALEQRLTSALLQRDGDLLRVRLAPKIGFVRGGCKSIGQFNVEFSQIRQARLRFSACRGTQEGCAGGGGNWLLVRICPAGGGQRDCVDAPSFVSYGQYSLSSWMDVTRAFARPGTYSVSLCEVGCQTPPSENLGPCCQTNDCQTCNFKEQTLCHQPTLGTYGYGHFNWAEFEIRSAL